MEDVNILAAIVAAIASFAGSAIWYMIFGNAMARLQREWRGEKPDQQADPRSMLVFLATALVLAFVVAYVLALADVSGWAASVGLGIVLWVGLVATQWAGSIVGEGVPTRLAAIHAGDWLMHLLIISSIVGVWQMSGSVA